MARHVRLAERGLTIIELLVAVAIVAVLATLAAPSLRQFMIEQRLKSTAGELLADVQMARNTALTMREGNVAVAIRSDANVTCYAVIPGITDLSTDCDCTRSGANFCQNQFGGAVPGGLTSIKTTTIDRSSGIKVGPNSTVYFSAYSGVVVDRASKTLNVVASPGGQVNVVVSGTGLPQICVPAGNNVSGYPACN